MSIHVLKDWSKSITGVKALDRDETLNLYSEMLATAHDLGYKVPDEFLIESEDHEKLKEVIPSLHEGLVTHHATVKSEAETKAKAAAKAPKPVKKTKKTETAVPKNPAKTVVKKEAAPKEKTKMAKTAKVAAPAAKPAKKAAAKAPAKKAAKKGAAKKAAGANARTSVGFRNPFGDTAVIKVLNKDTGIKEGSERYRRVMAALKYNNKKVSAFYAGEKAPLNRTDTLRFMIDQGFISIK